MMEKFHIALLLGVLIICGLSSFVDSANLSKATGDKKQLVDKSDSSNESDDDSKEKRSEENIMFGNQQNDAKSSFVDDILRMDDSTDSNKDESEQKNDTQTQDADKDDLELNDVLKDDVSASNEKKTSSINTDNYYMDVIPNSDDWYTSSSTYKNSPVYTDIVGYLKSPQKSMGDEINGVIQPEDIHKRNRQPWTVALRRRRSLRSPLGQMIQTRGRRLPRRSMRFKRQVDVQDILSLLNNADPNPTGKFFNQVPNTFNNFKYPETTSSFRHPYEFIRQDKNPDEEENIPNFMEDFSNNNRDDDDLFGYSEPSAIPLGSRYFEPEDYQISNIRPEIENDDQEMRQDWVEPEPLMYATRKPSSIFSVSRRSTPIFYPIDYRFIPGPGFKKRSFSGRHRNDEQETEFGKWGKVVNNPEVYASSDDVARLYDLASLLAENENSAIRTRRSVENEKFKRKKLMAFLV